MEYRHKGLDYSCTVRAAGRAAFGAWFQRGVSRVMTGCLGAPDSYDTLHPSIRAWIE